MAEKKMYICQNATCAKVFATPLKTINLRDFPPEPYNACPFCLTKIDSPEIETSEHKIPTPSVKDSLEKRKDTIDTGAEKPVGCPHHLGYLSERGQKDIPEGCLVCRDIVNCMLKKMRDA